MIAYLEGILASKDARSIVVAVGGVGYGLNVAASIFSRLPQTGEKIKIFTSLIVREDSQTLYGFLTREEKNLFQILLSVSGIGPKVALSLLSRIELDKLVVAITKGKIDLLTSIPGVGQKTAQRLVIELKEKLAKEFGVSAATVIKDIPAEGLVKDAVSALMTLGYSPKEAREAILISGIDLSAENNLEEVIKKTLKVLS